MYQLTDNGLKYREICANCTDFVDLCLCLLYSREKGEKSLSPR
ncbi:hypothetical protein HMPREF0262_03192 [Clostridium sp. ATCC 29733]|nr:hypothetical protein HMPREF0262_03192 [Clostridium sp. ATCC 29733]